MKASTKYLKITLNIISTIIFVLFCCLVLPRLLSFFMPFVIAMIVAGMANPLVKFAERKLKLKRKLGSIVVIVLALALVVLIIYSVIVLVISEFNGLAESVPRWWISVSGAINEFITSSSKKWHLTYRQLPAGIQEWLDNALSGGSEALSDWVSGISDGFANVASEMASNIALTLISIIMCIIGSYFFVSERDLMAGFFFKHTPMSAQKRFIVVRNTMKNAVGGYFKAQFIIMSFVYIVLFIGLLILRVKYAFLIGFLIALLDFLPFFGTGTVMVPWALISFMQHNYKMAIGLLIVWGVSQLVRQLIQPKVLSTSVGLPPIPTLILLYVGFRVGGALGLIVAVPIGMIILNLYKAGMFSNFIYSIKLLVNDFSKYRRFSEEELKSEGIENNLPDGELDS